jgi:chromosome segregation ATPase
MKADIKFGYRDQKEPVNSDVVTYKLTPEELNKYLSKQKGDTKMAQNQAQTIGYMEEIKRLKNELAEAAKRNDELKNELDKLLDEYNKLASKKHDEEKDNELHYEILSLRAERDQLKQSLRETEDELIKESRKCRAMRDLLRELL